LKENRKGIPIIINGKPATTGIIQSIIPAIISINPIRGYTIRCQKGLFGADLVCSSFRGNPSSA